MARIEGFLNAMNQLGEMVDRFLNSTPFMGYVWGPIKFSLLVAEKWHESLDIVLRTYEEIGERIPSLKQYETLFERNPEGRRALELYCYDIFEFHYHALPFLNKPGWKRLFRSSWKSFDAQFRRILDSLGRHKEWIENEKSTTAILETQDMRKLAEARFMEITQLEKRRQLSAIMEKLSPPNFQLDHEIATEQTKSSSTGQWIFENPIFRAWSNKESRANPLLYIHGVPGAGKTILASVIINRLLSLKIPVLYFYCKHNQHKKNTFGDILRALVAQSISQDGSSLSYIYEVCSTKDRVMMTSMLEELLDVAFDSHNVSFVVLDGLDECTSGEAEKAISWFVSRCEKQGSLDSGQIRLACVGQRVETLQQLLSSAEEICLENKQHQRDIFTYVEGRAHDLKDEFEIDSQTETSIIKRTTDSAKSMFLFAKLVMENLSNQSSRYELLKEMDKDIFPIDLKDAYERVIANLLKVGPQRKAAMRIIEAVACAFRPLKWREIQALFFIDPEISDCDYEDRKLRKSCKKLCSSLIDLHREEDQLDSDATLTLVHESARHYLRSEGLLEVSRGHAEMGLFGAAYLTSAPFHIGLVEGDLTKWILAGYFAYHEYAVTYTVEHIIAIRDEHRDSPDNTRDDIETYLRRFIDAYAIPDERSVLLENGENSGLAAALQDMHPTVRARSQCFDLEQRTSRIREKIRSLACDPHLNRTDEHRLRELYGLQNFKCPKIGCYYFLAGFVSDNARTEHLNRHDRPFTCTEMDCTFAKFGFEGQQQLEGHLRHHHNSESSEIFVSRKRLKRNHDIFQAASRGDVQWVETYLNDGTYVDVITRGGDTPLIRAVQNSQLQICKMLVEHGADVNRITSRRRTALLEAVHAQSDEALLYLLSLEATNINAKVGDQGRTAFEEAVRMPTISKAMLFVDSGKLDWQSEAQMDPFLVALMHSNPTFLQRLLERRPKDIAYHPDLLWYAASNRIGDPEKKVKLLLETGKFDANRVGVYDGRTPLQMATRTGRVAMVDQLLAANSINNVNFQDEKGCTALHFAVQLGNLDLVRSLLATDGINIHVRNNNGESPFDLAASSMDDSIAKAMINKLYRPHILARYRAGLIPKKHRPPVDFASEDHERNLMLLEQQQQIEEQQNKALLQDYQMDMMIQEQRNKRRLLIAQQKQDLPEQDKRRYDQHGQDQQEQNRQDYNQQDRQDYNQQEQEQT
ncbi:MAG: hypothetical protein M1821_004617 [Bathelium mastoideum]|nr:MAG: hypothetical protein M1821_004617 [Bathelium mastoideum]